MISNKPYLLRAFYQWIVDNRCTPILVLRADFPGCLVPKEHIEDNEIALNVSPDAIRDFLITNKKIEFRASFSGEVHFISAPVRAALSIYAHENGEGMYFDLEEGDMSWTEEEDTVDAAQEGESGSGGGANMVASITAAKKEIPSHLRVVK